MMLNREEYSRFLKNKVAASPDFGFEIDEGEINPILKPHQKAAVKWMVRGGRRACFASFGLGKTIIALEAVRLVLERNKGKGLIVIPLGVRQEFMRDAAMLGTRVKFIRRVEEVEEDTDIYLTNYETIRDEKMNPRYFSVASLDEAAILRGFGGSKTFRNFMALFTGDAGPSGNRRGDEFISYRFVATATPSPNDYIELLAYSAFLGILDVAGAKTRFFKRDSTKADKLTLHPHKEEEFWLWISTWAIFIQKPSDLGFSDEGYELPEMDVRWHKIQTDHSQAGVEQNGQIRMLKNAALGIQDAAREKRDSLDNRLVKMLEIRQEDPQAHRLIWHDLERERDAIEKTVPGVVTVYGQQELEKRESAIIDFSDGKIQELAGKPVMMGSGCNFQRYCNWAIFLGIGFKFADFIQAIHRIHRFLQTKTCRIDLIYTEAEYLIRKQLERKWDQHNEMVKKMAAIIKQYGLSQAAMIQTMSRKMGVEREEASGKNYKLVCNDAALELADMEENSVGLMLTSIPFSTQYEYSPNFSDLGHTDNNEHFFEHMDFITPNMFRVLQPGRIAAIHVKDRVVPGGMTGLGFQVVYPFHAKCIEHYTKHGFGYLGMKTIVTDVVRENNQTYRLGWTEQCKDGTKMGVGMPEYLLLFRKPPTDNLNSYADLPVIKTKERYTRAKWQIDAHGFSRSNGDRLLDPKELETLPHDVIFKLFRQHSMTKVYDFEEHVKIGEELDKKGRLPVTFMLLQPQSWHPDVWTDITRMLTLNGAQYAKGKELHLCPMQIDLVDRVIEQFSTPGETVLDPFSGLGTVPMRAVKLKRKGIGIELSRNYFLDSIAYCKAAEKELQIPTLFNAVEDKKV